MLEKILLIIGTFIMSMVCLMTLIIGWLGWTPQRMEAIIYLAISLLVFILYAFLLFKLRKRYSSSFLTFNILLYIIFFLNGNRLLPIMLDIFFY